MNDSVMKEIEFLTKQIEKELSKSPKKADLQKVRDYQNRIIELQDLKRTDKEQLEHIVEGLHARAEAEKQSCAPVKYSKNHKILVRIAATTLCILIFCLSSFSITAIALGGFHEAWTSISEYVSELLHLPPGIYEGNGITIIKGNSSQRFNSLEEFLKSQELSILYPDKLPQNTKLTKITLADIDDNEYIALNFNRGDITVSIKPIGKIIEDHSHLEIINGFSCYIYQYDEMYQAILYHEGKEYVFTSNAREDLIFIIKNLKAYYPS